MFNHLPTYPVDPIFDLLEQFKRDPRPQKLNLGIGVYTTEQGEPFVLPSVQKALRAYDGQNFNYLPIGGDAEFLSLVRERLFGAEIDSSDLVSQGTCGGTQAVALCHAIAKTEGIRQLLLAEPTWINHKTIFADFTIQSFPHINSQGQPNVDGYKQAIEDTQTPSVLLLHGGPTHNPTGLNLRLEDLKQLIPLLRERQIFVVLDFAYWGLGDGFDQDAEGVQLMIHELDNVAVCLSFSKNATLYCHRTGALFVKTPTKQQVTSLVRRAVRTTISNPPALGEKIIAHLLTHEHDAWEHELANMRQSIARRRAALLHHCPQLLSLQTTHGLFDQLPFTPNQIHQLKTDHAIYLPDDGRINVAGLTSASIPFIGQRFQTLFQQAL